MLRAPLASGLLPLGFLLLTACQRGESPCGRDVVGRIDGQPVTCTELTSALFEDQGAAFFDRYVERRLVEREARAAGLDVTPVEVEKATDAEIEDTLRTRFGGDRKALEAQVSRYGLSFEAWRAARQREKRLDLLAQALLRRGPDETALKAAFEQRFGKDGVRFRVRHLFLSTEPARSRLFPRTEYESRKEALVAERRALAERLRGEIAGGADFAALAREHSDDASAEQGGEVVGDLAKKLGPDVARAADGLAEGALSPVLETPRGFVLLRADGKRRGAHYQGAHLFVSARPTGPDDTRPEAERFAQARRRIDDARARILKGEPFGDVAREVTDDAVTRDRNGDLGAFETGRLGGAADRLLETAPLNACSEVVRTETGWEMVWLFAREPDPALDRRVTRVLFLSTEYPAVKRRVLGADLPARVEAEARELQAKIAAGADFAALARERSEDDSSRRNGGEVPNFRAGMLGDEVDAALPSMKDGEVRLVRRPEGFEIVQLAGRLQTDFATVVPDLRRELAEKAPTGGEVRRYLEDLRRRAKVERDF